MIDQKQILLISPEAWGPNFVSKHHYAHYLSKKNKVYFLNPPTGYSKIPFGDMAISQTAISDNLKVISYHNLLPRLNHFPKFIQRLVYKMQAKRIRKFISQDLDIAWSFDPFRFFDQNVWKAQKTIYFTVDLHFNKCFELDIAETSDLVLLSSDLLDGQFSKQVLKEKTVKLGHGADIENFEKDTQQVLLPGKNKLKIGVTGSFNHNVDYKLLEQIATLNPDLDVVLIGPYESNNLGKGSEENSQKVNELKNLSNVFFIGSVPSGKIMDYLKSLEMNLVLYKDITYNPHKMMGYFYSGKITISSWIYEYENADKDLLLMSRDNKDIPQLVKDTKGNLAHWNSPELIQFRRNFAYSNSYDSKIEQINSLLYKN